MKTLIYSLFVLLGGCIPYQLPPDGGGSPGSGGGSPAGANVAFEMNVNEIRAEKIPTWEWGQSELYVAMGSLKTTGDSTYQFYPSTGDFLVRQDLPSDRVFTVYNGSLRSGEAVAVNVSLLETDCHETNRLSVAQALVPDAANFRAGDTSGNVMTQAAQQELINGLIRAARLAITGFDLVLDQYCIINKDDVLGAFLFHAQNERGRIRWDVECVDTCEVATTTPRSFSIRFTSRGIHLVSFELAPGR